MIQTELGSTEILKINVPLERQTSKPDVSQQRDGNPFMNIMEVSQSTKLNTKTCSEIPMHRRRLQHRRKMDVGPGL